MVLIALISFKVGVQFWVNVHADSGEVGDTSRLSEASAGRSVVASAPALGAGDREFESPRPDHRMTTSTASSARNIFTMYTKIRQTTTWSGRENRDREPQSHPHQDLC